MNQLKNETTNKTEGTRFTLYNTVQLNTVLDRMAARAATLLHGRDRVTIVGILRRGAPLAEALCTRLKQHHGFKNITLLPLKIQRYADDLTLLHPETQLIESSEQITLDLTGHTVLAVDDVLYQGHSLLRAAAYLASKDATEIRTAVLVDRDVAHLPVRADIVGVRLDVPDGWVVECNVPPYESELKIELCCLPTAIKP